MLQPHPKKVEAPVAEVPAAKAEAVVPAAASVGYEDKPLNSVRKFIKKNMSASLQNIPQLTLNTSFDATVIMDLRKKFKNNEEFAGITLNDMLVHAVAKVVVADFPMLNAHLNGDTMRVFEKANVGVAVDTPKGLLVPAVIGASDMSLLTLSKELKSRESPTEAKANCRLIMHARCYFPQSATWVLSVLKALRLSSTRRRPGKVPGVDTITYKLRKRWQALYPAMGYRRLTSRRRRNGAWCRCCKIPEGMWLISKTSI